jgi:hypothetical protein
MMTIAAYLGRIHAHGRRRRSEHDILARTKAPGRTIDTLARRAVSAAILGVLACSRGGGTTPADAGLDIAPSCANDYVPTRDPRCGPLPPIFAYGCGCTDGIPTAVCRNGKWLCEDGLQPRATCPGCYGPPGSEIPTPPPTCSDFRHWAEMTITEAASLARPQCETDADCKYVDYGSFDCLDCVRVIGGSAVKAAIAARADNVRLNCQAFKDQGCQLIPSGCPPAESTEGWTCQSKKCARPR